MQNAVGKAASLVPNAMRRRLKPQLPEMTEPEVLRHYLHLSKMVHGMMGVNLSGTCTMKYNPRIATQLTLRPELAEIHPYQPDATIQGLLEIVLRFDLMLRDLSGMDQFVFQAAGGADAAYTHTCITRGYFAAKGELGHRKEIISTIQSHPCNQATAATATAGFNVITLPLEEGGYPRWHRHHQRARRNQVASRDGQRRIVVDGQAGQGQPGKIVGTYRGGGEGNAGTVDRQAIVQVGGVAPQVVAGERAVGRLPSVQERNDPGKGDRHQTDRCVPRRSIACDRNVAVDNVCERIRVRGMGRNRPRVQCRRSRYPIWTRRSGWCR